MKLYSDEGARERYEQWKMAIEDTGRKNLLGVEHVDQMKPPPVSQTVIRFDVRHVSSPNQVMHNFLVYGITKVHFWLPSSRFLESEGQ